MNSQIKLIGLIVLLIISFVIIFIAPINLGLDLQGGIRLVYEARETPTTPLTNEAVLGSLEIVRNRIDSLGVSEPLIQRKGKNQIIVELPGVKDPARAIALVGDSAVLEFAPGAFAPSAVKAATKDVELLFGKGARFVSYQYKDKNGGSHDLHYYVAPTMVSGTDLKYAGPSTDEYGRPSIAIEFTPEGAAKMFKLTGENIGKPMIVMLDGKIISAPTIQSAIGEKGVITGQFSVQEMTDLIIKLKAGSLPIPLELIENKVVGPTLGADSISKSWKAGLLGFLFVAIFMTAYYRIPGLISIGALLIYTILDFAILSAMGATLTLPGIAGFILTIGMAVDANVLIFERIKQEIRRGRSYVEAIPFGFDRAFSSIVDSNVTTIIGAVVLFWLGTGTIKGFAITLITGVLVSMFSAIVLTRFMIDLTKNAKIFNNHIMVKR